MSLVIDASVAIKWAVGEEGSDAATALLGRGEPPVAPQFVLLESANVLWKKVARRELDGNQAEVGFALIKKAFPTLVPDFSLIDRALSIALELSHPVYDCLYLACAESTGFPLVTADKRLHEKARSSRHAGLLRFLDHPTSAGST
ncbi:MAG: type II toxin-antitoxin system VapC family toxin [Methylobacterium mesophilicum]|nr:type II toxin-antitoxin system VapC family toxin [Methylobacterium mesophilicum]